MLNPLQILADARRQLGNQWADSGSMLDRARQMLDHAYNHVREDAVRSYIGTAAAAAALLSAGPHAITPGITPDSRRLQITHNLIFETETEALDWIAAATLHFADNPRPLANKLCRHGRIVVVNDKTFTRLDAAGALDNSTR